MKRVIACIYLFSLLLLLINIDSCYAQEADSAVEINFHFVAKDKSGEKLADLSGVFTYQGTMFFVQCNDVNIYCDGNSKWVYDKINEEITIIPHDPTSNHVTENPLCIVSPNGEIPPIISVNDKEGNNYIVSIVSKNQVERKLDSFYIPDTESIPDVIITDLR